MRLPRHRLLATAALAVLGLLLTLFAAEAGATSLPSGFQDEVAFELGQPGLEQPTNFKFAPDGRTFVALKGGKIAVYPKESAPNATPDVFANLAKEVYDNGDHGLLGLALDPKFDEGRPYVYALYTFNHELGAPAGEVPKWPSTGSGPTAFEGDSCPEENKCMVSGRLVRLTAEGNHAKASGGVPEEHLLLEDWCEQSTTHSIGNLQFGPEGALFASGGEGAIFTVPDYGQFDNRCGDPDGTKGVPLSAEDKNAEGGSLRSQSILRANGQVTLDGTVVRIDPNTGEGWPGNPFAASLNANARRIVGFGFRNPFRFVLNPRLGELFVNNVGNGDDEEIDRLPIGAAGAYNSGWPCYEGLEPNYQFQVLGLNACERLYATSGSTSAPFFYYTHSSPVAPGDTCPTFDGSAISGSAFYEGDTYPSEYDNALFFADSVRGCIYAMRADDDGEPDPLSVTPFLSEGETYPGVDLEQGPDGLVYYANLYANTVHRIAYDPGAPVARVEADRQWGPTPLAVSFDAAGSSGPSGDALSYHWDLDGDGQFDDGTSATIAKTYSSATNVTVAVRVEDTTTGKSSVASLKIYPGDTPPQVTISEPAASLSWGVGQPIQFAGSATAKEGTGAAIPEASLYWKARLLHCPFGPVNCHEHPIQIFPGTEAGEFAAPDHDYPSYITLFLTATDERGLSAEASVKIPARPVSLGLRSEPPGVALVAGTKTLTTPAELQAIEGSPTTVAAPETAVVNGVSYSFQGWSDGGARVHTVPATASATYTAIYAGPPAAVGGGTGGSTGGGEPSARLPGLPRVSRRPAARTNATSARFVFGGETDVSFRCRLDGGRFGPCRSPRVYRHLRRGWHSFRVYAVDADGGRSRVRLVRWKIVGR